MNMAFLVKYKWWILGGTIGLVATRLFSSGSSQDSSPSYAGYDPALVSLGIQAGIEQDRMKQELQLAGMESADNRFIAELNTQESKYLAELSANTELKLNEANNNATLQQVSLLNAFALEDTKLETDRVKMQLDQEERVAGAKLAYQNAWVAADYADKASERQQQYNLANYQTMVSHDLGKKGIKADFWGGIAKTASSSILAFLGK